jgi:phytoene dehydrogenase-like protein
MKNENGKIDKNATIVIVGAGPAGLSTAWFLSKNGYHNVTVLEKLGRVGGLCKSLTVDGMSYDHMCPLKLLP